MLSSEPHKLKLVGYVLIGIGAALPLGLFLFPAPSPYMVAAVFVAGMWCGAAGLVLVAHSVGLPELQWQCGSAVWPIIGGLYGLHQILSHQHAMVTGKVGPVTTHKMARALMVSGWLWIGFGVFGAAFIHGMEQVGIIFLIAMVMGVASLIGAQGFKWQWPYLPLAAMVIGLGVASWWTFHFVTIGDTIKLKSRQAEARTNLGGIYVAETAFYGEHKRYGTFEEIGFTLGGTPSGTCNLCRYIYRIDISGKRGTVISAGRGSVTPDNTKVPAGFSPTGFTATATGNIDDDPILDQWHVNDAKQGLDKADVNDVVD